MFFLNPVTTATDIIITANESDMPKVVMLTIERDTYPLLSFPETNRFAINNSKFKSAELILNKPTSFFLPFLLGSLV